MRSVYRRAAGQLLAAGMLAVSVWANIGCAKEPLENRGIPEIQALPPKQDAREAAGSLRVIYWQNTEAAPRYDLFEIVFRHENRYSDPFFDVDIQVTFTSPSGEEIVVGGFFYGSLEKPEIIEKQKEGEEKFAEYHYKNLDTWKARFAPWEPGRWKYHYVFRNREGEEATGKGTFSCVEGKNPLPGFLRQSQSNPYRWVSDDGSPFIPVGFQDCHSDWSAQGTLLDTSSMEGPFRLDRDDPLPQGPLYVRGPAENPQNKDVCFRTFAACGFNLYRFSQNNCSLSLYADLDHYYVHEAVMVDELLMSLRKYGFRIFYGIFGYHEPYLTRQYDGEEFAKVKRFITYSVNRWGALVDIWQFLNELKAGNFWYETMIPHLRSADPYDHPITTSWERPELEGIEINVPHWYQSEDELYSDFITASNARRWKSFGKPVIVGEQGNEGQPWDRRKPGIGGVWDAGSAGRMRLRLWTAFFNEISFVFWNTSYARDGHIRNLWIGPREREYVRALQDFSSRIDPEAEMTSVYVSRPEEVRGYGLESGRTVGIYLHHSGSHAEAMEGLELNLDIPASGRGYWYSPATAEILSTFDVSPGQKVLEVPPFTVDLALLITPDGPPDIDGDGIPNNTDSDDDNDGTPDTRDAFPLEPSEWGDEDGDLIGDNMDADDDGDGRGDDRNGNGTPDHEELDFDGDGIPRAQAVPWDAFPLDPQEWQDTDGDGIGDNADTDDDGDGFPDTEEEKAGTDPKLRVNFPS